MGWDKMGWDGTGWDSMGWGGVGWDLFLFCFVRNALARFVLVPSRVNPYLVVVALLPPPPFLPNAKGKKNKLPLSYVSPFVGWVSFVCATKVIGFSY